jgi:hypothetical protein
MSSKRAGRTLVGPLVTIALIGAACGGVPPSQAPTGSVSPAPSSVVTSPSPTTAALTEAPGASPTASFATFDPGATLGATAPPPSSPPPLSATSGAWRTVTSDALVYLGFGIAGNGDVIAIAAPAGPPIGKYEIIRANPDSGAILSRAPLTELVDLKSGLPFYVDATNDNVIGFVGAGTGIALLRLESGSGKVLKQTKPAVSINQVAVDRQGRIYANTVPYPGTKEQPELLVRLGADGKVAAKLNVTVTRASQLNDPGKLACGYYNFKRIVTYYGWTVALAVSPNGTIQSLQIPSCVGSEPKDRPFFDTFKPDFTHLRRAILPLEWPGGSPRWSYWESVLLAMAAQDSGTTYLVEAIGPASGDDRDWDGRSRLRAIGTDGKVLATWGAGGNLDGLGNPQRVAIDGSGRVWVVDQDPKTHRQSIKVLEPAS